MANSGTSFFRLAFLLAVLAGSIYLSENPLIMKDFLQRTGILSRPCQKTITYSIGTFDNRFGISRDEFLEITKEAAQIWSNSVQKNLFSYASSGGDITVSLIYDYRQEVTEKMRKMGISIHTDKNTYESLKAKYDSMQASYGLQKKNLEAVISAFQIKKNAYEKRVAYWNSQKGIPKDEYDKLEQERIALNAQSESINEAQRKLNDSINDINAIASVLNKLAAELNLGVSKYNSIGEQLGDEFQEGEYKSSPSGTEINIYQFDDKEKLKRVLAHELGHALELEHIDNPKAIMYRLNEGANSNLTVDDVAALKKVCEIQ